MKGLFLKDFYGLKAYMRQYVILLVFFMIFGISMGNSHYIMWMSLVLGINISFSTFPADEAGGYAYMLSCPVDRRTCVQAKYMIGIAGGALIFVCSVIGEALNCLSTGSVTESWLLEMAVVLGIYFFFTAVLLPVSYRYGVEKARVVILGMIAVPMVLVFLSVKLIRIPAITELLDLAARTFTQEYMFVFGGGVFFGVSLLLLGGSYLLSVRIFERKEF